MRSLFCSALAVAIIALALSAPHSHHHHNGTSDDGHDHGHHHHEDLNETAHSAGHVHIHEHHNHTDEGAHQNHHNISFDHGHDHGHNHHHHHTHSSNHTHDDDHYENDGHETHRPEDNVHSLELHRRCHDEYLPSECSNGTVATELFWFDMGRNVCSAYEEGKCPGETSQNQFVSMDDCLKCILDANTIKGSEPTTTNKPETATIIGFEP